MYVKEVLLSSEDLDIYYDPKYPDPNPDCKHDWDVFKYQCYVTFYTCIRNIYNCTNCNIFKMEVEEHQTREITNISFHEISPMEWMFKTTHDPVEYDEYFGHYECPECKSDEVADILFGLPDFTEELSNQLSAGHVVLGGCMILEEFQPDFHCNNCEYQWDARYPEKGRHKEKELDG